MPRASRVTSSSVTDSVTRNPPPLTLSTRLSITSIPSQPRNGSRYVMDSTGGRLMLRSRYTESVHHDEELATFERALAEPMPAQEVVRQRILEANCDTEYGRAHGFASIGDYASFDAAVPIVSYDEIEPFMLRMIEGEQRVLIAAPAVYFGVSSGTTGRPKYAPIHAGFAAETELWMALERAFLHRAHPGFEQLVELRYVNRVEGTVPSGLPCGAVSAWYYGELHRHDRYREIVPFEAFQLSSVNARNYAVLRFALAQPVGRLTAVNPSTLLLVSRILAASHAQLVRDVHDGDIRHPELPETTAGMLRAMLRPDAERARELERSVAEHGALTAPGLWPTLRLLSCWMHAGASLYRADLATAFGPLPIWDYGYTSTEGRVTITVDDEGSGVPLLTSAFFELRDDAGHLQPLAAARPGVQGEVIVTNSRGLYRYATGDVVAVTGMLERTPLLKYQRKLRATASLTGEKLTEAHVLPVVDEALRRARLDVEYFCLCAEWGEPPRYVLALEPRGSVPDAALQRQIADAVEQGLVAANNEYEKKRETLRLGGVVVRVLPSGARRRYLEEEIAKGRELARIKLPSLTMDLELLKRLSPSEGR
jgi:hypothetical protein